MKSGAVEWLERWIGAPAARERGRVQVVDPRNVSWVGAERDYVRYHMAGRSILVRKTMAAAERELAPRRFVRIHRSAIVNLDCITELRPVAGGDCRVVLRCGTVLRLSRSFRKRAAGFEHIGHNGGSG